MSGIGKSFLGWLAELATRRAWLVIGVSLVLTALASWASTTLTINTSTDDILAYDLPFRQTERAMQKVFPREETFIVVLDAATPAEARRAAGALADRLRGKPSLFRSVDVPGLSPFFQRNAFLFIKPDELTALGNQIGQARPLLTTMARDPSLRGLAGLFGGLQISADATDVPEAMPRLFNDMANAATATAEGREARVDWAKFFEGGSADPGEPRQIVITKPAIDNSSLERAVPALDALHAEIAAVAGAIPGVSARVTGEPALRQQELNDAFSGAMTASILSFVLVALSLIVGIRSGRLIIALLLTLVIGSIWSTGLAAVTVGSLNLISVAFLVLFFGLGVDFGTHLGLRYLEEARTGGGFERALTQAMLHEGPSIGLSAVCAAVAFVSFVPTDYTGLAEFGIISALGMLVAVVITFTVQPAFMALMPPKPVKPFGSIGIGSWIERNYRAILIVALVVSLGAIVFAVQARVDVNPLNLQDPRTEAVSTYRDLARDPNTSPYVVNVLVPDAAAVEPMSARLAAVPGVGSVLSAASFVPQQQPEKLAQLEQIRTRLGTQFFQANPIAPPSEAALRTAANKLQASFADMAGSAAQGSPLAAAARKLADGLAAFKSRRGDDPGALKALDTALIGNFPELVQGLRGRLSVSQPVTLAELPADLTERWIAKDGRFRLQVQPAGDISDPAALESFATRIQAIAPDATGMPISVTEAGDVILRAFLEATLYTVVAIAFIVVVLRRRLADVVLVLTPLAIAALWTVAGSVLLGVPFNFANIIVIPMLVGLGVASSVHIVVRARELEKDGAAGPDEGTRLLDTSTPLAVLVAQLNTVAAFATLTVSSHMGLYSMGLLLGLSILLVLIVSLVVLPAALVAIDKGRHRVPTIAGEQSPAGSAAE
jgi:uncharacterized protein